MNETSIEFIRTHLQNSVAAEQNFEDILSRFSDEGDQEDVKNLFLECSKKARTQHQRLAARLQQLGGSPSTLKNIAAHVVGFSPLVAQAGQTPQEKNTQHLIMGYAAAASEMAMYETLAVVSAQAGDRETEALARQLQREEKEDHDLFWRQLGTSAQRSFMDAASQD